MRSKKIDVTLIKSLSNMKKTDYSASQEISDIYKRLSKGRDTFAGIYELNIDAVAEISELDMEIRFYTEKLMEITSSISEATVGIHAAAVDSSEVVGVVAGRHEDLTNTIISVSEESSNVYQKIDTSQKSLTEIRRLSENTITISEKMHKDMNQLAEIINNMNEVIGSINAISSQTNLLSLNASIEAARAGDAGKGFAVVADEIRALADETKQLTNNMGSFVLSVQNAAEASVESVESAISSLEEVNNRIKDVWVLNEENQNHVAGITDSISNLAAVSEEISSSMNEIEARSNEIEHTCSILKEDVGGLENIGASCTEAVKPLKSVEEQMDRLLREMGEMSSDAFYSLSQQELTEYVSAAITAHKKWISKLGNIINNGVIIPFQVDGNKCRFGHFFNSIEPSESNLKTMWHEIGQLHQKLHKLGAQVISALFDDNQNRAKELYSEAEKLSLELISKLERLLS